MSGLITILSWIATWLMIGATGWGIFLVLGLRFVVAGCEDAPSGADVPRTAPLTL